MKEILYSFLVFNILAANILNPSLYTVNTNSNLKTDDEMKILLNDINKDYDIPEESSEVSNLPWRNDKQFLHAKEKYNTPVLMAAYCAVLKNPLPGEAYNVKLTARNIKGKVVGPSKIFSQNANLGPYTRERGYKDGASYSNGNIVMTEGGGVCKIATVLYNVSVLSNLEIVERHNHSMPINYVPYGQDATVASSIKDFKFKNTTDSNILIWAEFIDEKLYMAFYGPQKPPEISWDHIATNKTKAPIRYIKNENLSKGEMKVILEGLEGASVKSSITIKYPNGTIRVQNMGISNYIPLPRLIEIN